MKANPRTEASPRTVSPANSKSQISSRPEAEAAVALVAALTVELAGEVNEQNGKLMAAREHDERIGALQGEIQAVAGRLEAWARGHRAELGLGGEEDKSLDLRQGVIGFRWGKPKLECRKGWDWEKVVAGLLGEGWSAALNKLLVGLRCYVRVKVEVDKQRIVADAKPDAGRLTPAALKGLGLAIEREEKFYVEPKLECVTP